MADAGSESIATGVVIVGAGHAGIECAFALRTSGYEGGIVLLGNEPHVPYQRPPLSKAFLAGDTTLERIGLKADDGCEKHGITLVLGEHVTRLDAAAHTLDTMLGRRVRFEHCVLALGAHARMLPEVDGPDLHVIRTLDDALALRPKLTAGRHLLVVGGGYLGLETASTAAKLGARVTVLEQAQTLMSGRVSAHTSHEFEILHRQAGVAMARGVIRKCVHHADDGWRVELEDGTQLMADILLVSIGALPNTMLAEQAGLACDRGILVDEACRTSDPDIYAIGDCASSPRPALGVRARVESVQNALEQARIAAAAIAGKPLPILRPSTFWSEQQGKRLQMAGLARPDVPCEDIVSSSSNGWVVERYQNGVLAVIEAVGSPVEFVKGAKRIGQPADARVPSRVSPEKERQ